MHQNCPLIGQLHPLNSLKNFFHTMSSAGVHQHTHTSSNPGTTQNEENKNPIYDSIEDDVEHLEQMISLHDSNFDSVTKEVWRDVVSPSSSISSINTSDSDDEDFSGYISIEGSYSLVKERRHSNNNNFCDKLSDADTEDTLNESRISLQEINMQIGVAEELVLTPNSRQKHNNKHLFTNLETIHEGKFLHTPPKSATDRTSPRTNRLQPSNMLFERLERD